MKHYTRSTLLFLLFPLILWLLAGLLQADRDADTRSVFAKRTAATNPARLLLFQENRQVIGWISGMESHVGKDVELSIGKEKQSVEVEANNFFRFTPNVEPTSRVYVRARIGDLSAELQLQPEGTKGKCVYFIVDRNVYRPRQEMKFAGYLRQMGINREFTPQANTPVRVELRSASRNTLTSSIELTSDEHGRITGSYTFSEGDAVDGYVLTIPGFRGQAHFKLAEFRKSKVRLKLDHEVVDQKLHYTFRALDFLNNPVPGSRVDYNLQVVSAPPASDADKLNPRQFVFDEGANMLHGLSEENRLLAEAGLPLRQAMSWAQVMHQESRNLSMAESGEAKGELKLQPEWIENGYKVIVNGVMIDHNGREQRSSCEVPLKREVDGHGTIEDDASKPAATTVDSFLLPLPRVRYEVGESIRLPGTGPEKRGVLLVHKLESNPQAQHHRRGYYYGMYPNNGLHESLYTAVPLDVKPTELPLKESGVYRLETVVHEDGTQRRRHRTIRVAKKMSGLRLELDSDEVSDLGTLKGAVHGSFDDARVLLLLSDARGARLLHPLTLKDGRADFDLPIPDGIGYGSTVTVLYPAEQRNHQSIRSLTVRPDSRSIEIITHMPKVVTPGQEVEIDLEVNRKEEVDLIVSVYDHSLLGISPDQSINIRNFFLADEFNPGRNAIENVCRILGDLTFDEARKKLKAWEESTADVYLRQMLQTWNRYLQNDRTWFYSTNLALLLKQMGYTVNLHSAQHSSWSMRIEKDVPLAESLRKQAGGRNIYVQQIGDCFVFSRHLHNLYGYGYGYYGGWAGQNLAFASYGGIRARGDAWHSFAPSANGFISGNAAISGQALLSVMPPQPAPAVQANPNPEDGPMIRRNFSDTAFFNAGVRTDKNGKANVQFKLPDSLTNWRVVVHAVSRSLHVGQAEAKFRTFKPVMIWPMPARSFTVGDRVNIYAMVHNRTEKRQDMRVWMEVDNGKIHGPAETTVSVPAGKHVNVYWTYEPAESGYTAILMSTECAAGNDASLKRLPVRPCVAVSHVTASGLTREEGSFVIPDKVDFAKSDLQVTLSPSLPADLTETLEYLVQYPHGCVEQTMSRFLPLVKVGQILKQFDMDQPALTARIPGFAEAGVKRLIALQKPDGGWGWIGNSQTHEMMTPYALYGLIEAKKAGFDFDQQQTINNGLNRLRNYIDSQNARHPADTVYCAYVYNQERDLEPDWWHWIERQVKENRLSDYALALVLEMCHLKPHDENREPALNRKKLADRIAKRLEDRASRQHHRTWWTTANFSRWGNDRYEISAAVMRALVAHNAKHELISEVLNFFHGTKRGNRWNSTKDTAMVVFAMCDYLGRIGDQDPARRVVFTVNDGEAQTVNFQRDQAVTLDLPVEFVKHGANKIQFVEGDEDAMYRLVFRHRQEGRDIQPSANGLEVTRKFFQMDADGKDLGEVEPGGRIKRGNYLKVEVQVKQPNNSDFRFVLVNAPKPSGCEIVPVADKRFPVQAAHHALREDRTSNIFWHHEHVQGNQIVNQVMLHTELAGTYRIPPAEAEFMYQTELRGHSGAFEFEVVD